MIGPVLVIDDDADVLHAARMALSREATHVETRPNPDGLEAVLEGEAFEAVLLDMNFVIGDHSGRQGLDQLARIHGADPSLSIVLMTAFGGVALAVEALKRGAVDFVLKPWRNDALLTAVSQAADVTRTRRRNTADFDLEAVERGAIERALTHHEGNITRAAQALGLTRPALYRRMAKHGL